MISTSSRRPRSAGCLKKRFSNPVTASLREAERHLEDLQQRVNEVRAEIDRYRGTDRAALVRAIDAQKARIEKLVSEREATRRDRDAVRRQIDSVHARMGSWLNPRNWFDAEQWELAGQSTRLRNRCAELDEALAKIDRQIDEARQESAATARELAWYDAVDIDLLHNRCAALQRDHHSAKREVQRLRRCHAQARETLRPCHQQLRSVDAEIQSLNDEIESAEEFERQLNNAADSYERAMIHQQCEHVFGHGSPRHVMATRRKRLDALQRDRRKLAERFAEEEQRIETLVRMRNLIIDGNNLCYANGDEFVGVAPLQAVLEQLHGDYRVTIVFDAGITHQLRLGNTELRRLFPEDVEVHVVAAGRRADETVLALAADASDTYVLSNDRFSDFFDKDAVREQRLIRHEIVNGRVLIHALGVDAHYA